jgi:hypothetical protein
MTIDLKPEQVRIIQAEIATGNFRTPEKVLDRTLADSDSSRSGAHQRHGRTLLSS